MWPNLKGAKAVVYGLGKSGVGSAQLLHREGARVVGLDSRTEAELGGTAASLKQLGVELVTGKVPPELLSSAALVVVSPGVPLALPEIQRAKEQGVPVVGEVELAYRFLKPKEPLVGITGTNGKSTTTAL